MLSLCFIKIYFKLTKKNNSLNHYAKGKSNLNGLCLKLRLYFNFQNFKDNSISSFLHSTILLSVNIIKTSFQCMKKHFIQTLNFTSLHF